MRDDLVRGIGGTSGLVEPLARGLGGLFKNTSPGFIRALEASKPVLEMLAAKLPGLGDDLSTMFDSFADAGPGATVMLGDLLDILGDAAVDVGEFVESMSKGYHALRQFTSGLAEGISILPQAKFLLDRLGPDDTQIAKLKSAKDEMAEFGSFTEQATRRVQDWSAAMDEAFGEQMDLDQAALQYKQTMLELTQAVKDHGTDLRETTQVGLDNREMILGWIEDAKVWRDTQIAMGDGSKAAIETANAAYQSHLTQIRATLVNLGFQKKAIDDIMTAYQKLSQMPSITKTVTVRQVSPTIQGGAPRGTIGFFSQGGPITGQGPRGVDSQLIAAAPGEYMLNTRMVDQLGGVQALERIRTGGGNSYMAGSSAGGGGGVGGAMTLHVTGGGGSLEQALAQFVHHAVRTGLIQLKVSSGQSRVVVG